MTDAGTSSVVEFRTDPIPGFEGATMATIALNRPAELNAMSWDMIRAFDAAVTEADADQSVRVVFVTGRGRAFSAGGDLAMVQTQIGNFRHVAGIMKEAGDIVYNIIDCEKPIISAINGVAVGAGLAVAIMADISIMAEDARITDGHIRLGVGAGDHAAIIWPLLCGMAKAKYYLLLCDAVSGAEAEARNTFQSAEVFPC